MKKLIKDSERIIWEGSPNPLSAMNKFETLIKIVFAFIFLRMGVFFSNINMSFMGEGIDLFTIVSFLIAIIIPSIIIYDILSQFIKYKNTKYILTDKKIIIESKLFKREISILDLDKVEKVDLKEKLNNRGNIIFEDDIYERRYTGNGNRRYLVYEGKGFMGIDNVFSVYNKILEAIENYKNI